MLPALRARREHCDAMIGILSAGEIVKLSKLGSLKMDGSDKGPLAALKKLRGSRDQVLRLEPDGGAAPPAEAAEVHSRRRPGPAQLLPDACSTGCRDRRTTSSPWCGSWSAATPTARAGACAAGSMRRSRRNMPRSASTTPARPDGSWRAPTASRRSRPSRWARSVCSCCAPTCCRTMPVTTTGSSTPWRRGACGFSRLSRAASTAARPSRSSSSRTAGRWSMRSSPSPASPSWADPPTTTPAPPRTSCPGSTSPTSPASRWSSRPWKAGASPPPA